MFTAIRTVTLNAQLGPFDTFEEFQAAIAREIPGAVAIKGHANSGEVKSASGAVIAGWSSPYQMVRPVTLNAITGPLDTFEGLQAAVSAETPGTVLHVANPKVDKHSGEITNSTGQSVGKWTEK